MTQANSATTTTVQYVETPEYRRLVYKMFRMPYGGGGREVGRPRRLPRLEGVGIDPPLRRGAAAMSARTLTWAMLAALPEAQQAAYWRAVMARWQANAEREADADFAFDHSPERLETWGACT